MLGQQPQLIKEHYRLNIVFAVVTDSSSRVKCNVQSLKSTNMKL